jgi:hypothetical protein
MRFVNAIDNGVAGMGPSREGLQVCKPLARLSLLESSRNLDETGIVLTEFASNLFITCLSQGAQIPRYPEGVAP